MRIGLVIDNLDPRRGGLSQWCSQFVHALARRGFELHVASQDFGPQGLSPNVSPHAVPRTTSRVEFAQAAAARLAPLKLDLIHDMGVGFSGDILQPHGGSHTAWLTRRLDMYPRLLRAIKRPIDALMPRHRDFNRHWRKQRSEAVRSSAKFVAISNMVAERLVQLDGVRPAQIAVVYNGVDCKRFSPDHRATFRQTVRRQLGLADEVILLLQVAHNFRLKGVPELMKVTARLVAAGRPVHLAIVGGKRLDKWRSRAIRLGLAGKATFVGTVGDLVPYYAAADAYVHPTYYDPCSLVLLEAAASGLPIVTTRRYNGAAELFREDNDILTVDDPAELDALYQRVDALLDEQLRRRLGVAARNVAVRHPFEKNVGEILRLYDDHLRCRLAA